MKQPSLSLSVFFSTAPRHAPSVSSVVKVGEKSLLCNKDTLNDHSVYHYMLWVPDTIRHSLEIFLEIQRLRVCSFPCLKFHILMTVAKFYSQYWKVETCSFIATRKLCYRKDDCAMRPIHGALKIYMTLRLRPRLLFRTIPMGFCSDPPYECSFKIWSR